MQIHLYLKRVTRTLSALFIVTLLIPVVRAAEHSPTLDNVLAVTPANQTVAVILFLENRLKMDEVYPVAKSLPMSERRQYVVKALQARFEETSPRVMEELSLAQKRGGVTLLRPLWILNAIRVTLTPAELAALEAKAPEVTYVVNDAVYEDALDDGWGVFDIGAPRVWTELGADGSGVIVGHKDSGVDWDLPQFDGHIWINAGEDLNHNGIIEEPAEVNGIDDDGNGYVDDFRGWNFDDNTNNVLDVVTHGTRTASIISSGFGVGQCDTVSVAPGAKLMLLRGYLTHGALFESSQYAIAMGAQVISASVSYKQSECAELRTCPNYVAFRWASEMELAAGIIHANSTGDASNENQVPLCVPAPANCPPPAMTSSHEQQGGVSSIVAVGGYLQSGALYTLGGIGPSAWSSEDICVSPWMSFCEPEGSVNAFPAEFEDYPYHGSVLPGLAKPDITAPTSVSAVTVGGGCSSICCTSGATPHAGGVLALIYSAFPGITPEDAYLVLVNGAEDAGPAGFDSLWGFGKLRAFAACSSGVVTRALVTGLVVEQEGGEPISNARVSTTDTQPVLTDITGHYELSLDAGTYQLLYEKYGYADAALEVVLSEGEERTLNVALQPAILTSAQGTVTGSGAPLDGMTVSIPEASLETETDANGHFTFNGIYVGTYDVSVGDLPWETISESTEFVAGENILSFNLNRSPIAMTSGPDVYGYYIYDQHDAPAATYDWIEIDPDLGGQGTNLNLTVDNFVARTLPFTAQFYGQTYNTISIMANGFIIFGTPGSSEWGPYPIPSAEPPNNYVAPFFLDWAPQNGDGVFYYADTDNHRVIVEWSNVPDYFNYIRATFQAIIHDPEFPATPTGDSQIIFQYSAIDGHFDGLIGLENATGADGIQYQFVGAYDFHAAPVDSGSVLLITTDTTLLADEEQLELPREFSLESNYPNPFNPTTTFVWNMPITSSVRLALFDVLGRESAVVFEGMTNAGRHELLFDASDLPTGVYFARLERGGESVAVRKILLLK